MLERDVERRLVSRLRAEVPAARCLKFTSPGCSGVPDRIILLPGGAVVFAELKRPGEKPRALQTVEHERLRRLGFQVYGCVDSYDMVEAVVLYCRMVSACSRIGSEGVDP